MNKKVGGAWGFITESFVNALRDKNHEVLRYDDNLETWHSFDPDIYIGCSGHKENIPKNTRTKKAIHTNPFGPVNINGINESQETIDWVANQNPDLVFGYGSPNDRIFWSYWYDRLGIPWIPMPTAGDKTIFNDLHLNRHIDLVYLGGRWPYKAKTIDKYLMPVLQNLDCSKMVRGWGGWPPEFQASQIEDSEVNGFFNIGKVGPCMSEIHTQQYGIDIPERFFKLALCGVLAVHDPVPSIKSMVPSAVVASNPSDYASLIKSFIDDESSRIEIAAKQKEEVLKAHTYHHRMASIFDTFGFSEEAKLLCI